MKVDDGVAADTGDAAQQEVEAGTLLTDAKPTDGEGEQGEQKDAEGEQQASDDKGEGESSSEGEAKDAGAPESYEFKQQEGIEIDDAVVSAYSEVAKELNLSQENAQKMLDTMASSMAERQAEQIAAVHESWANDTKSDKELGGEKLNENLAVAKKAMDAFGTPELTTLLNETGIGNHPEIIRAFYRAGLKISEDTFVNGDANPQGDKPMAERMYPGMNP